MRRRSKSGVIAVVLGALSAIASASVAQAAWIKAETDRFIVYGEGREARVREYAVKLHTFDAVLRAFHPRAAAQPPGHKVEVYLVDGARDLRQIAPHHARTTRGFYSTSADAIVAVVDTSEVMEPDDILFHEYAHHFMHENFPAAYPAWFVEGWAEYFMTTKITADRIIVGGYSDNRVYWLFNTGWLPMKDLLTKTAAQTARDYQAIYYPQAWILMHYMRSDPERAAQMDKATSAIAAGEDPVKAMETATGLTLDQLALKLKRYTKLPIFNLTNPVKSPAVLVTALPPSADDVMLAKARLDTSEPGARDEAFLTELRARAARHPGDRLAELTLAHAEFLMGDVAAGEAIVQRRMAADPKDVDAIRLAGRGQVLAGLRAPDERSKRFAAARTLAGKAYQLDKRDYRILYQYAFARTIQPDFPTDNDIEALTQAYLLAPSVEEVAMTTGIALIAKGETAKAKRLLARIANNPHGGALAAEAKALIEGKAVEEETGQR
jgi:hypothetical protein